MSDSGHASAFCRYKGIDDFLAAAVSEHFKQALLSAIPLELRAQFLRNGFDRMLPFSLRRE
jgi:hypothetical protein